MSDMIDRAAAIDRLTELSCDDNAHWGAIIDAMRDLPAVHVAVKPLELETDLGDGILTARAYGHIYRIIPTTEGGFFVPELLPLHFQNPSAAKAAVQSTHERHIAHLLTITPAPDPAQIREAALREAADMLARQGYGTAVRQILALIPTPPAVSDDVAAQKRQQAAQTLWDLLHMKNGAHDGMTSGDVHALWDDVKEEAGYAAVTAFLAKLIRAQPHDTTALDRVKAEARAEAIREAANRLPACGACGGSEAILTLLDKDATP